MMEVLMLIDFDPYRLSEEIYAPIMNYKPLDNEAIAMYYHVMAKLEKISAIEVKSQESIDFIDESIQVVIDSYKKSDQIIEHTMDKLIDYTADIQSSSLDFASSLRQLQTLSKVTRRKHSNLIPEDEGSMIRTKDMVITAKRTTAAKNISEPSGKKSPYKFEILKTAKTSLMVPPSSDEKIVELFNLPKNSKIVTNDGQSPFASFFTTGWFEPEPSG